MSTCSSIDISTKLFRGSLVAIPVSLLLDISAEIISCVIRYNGKIGGRHLK